MTQVQSAARHADLAGPAWFVVTADDTTALDDFPRGDWTVGLECLIEQEVAGRRAESVPSRLAELLHNLGFGWEPLSEPGHMRFVGPAATMIELAKGYAAATAQAVLGRLGVPVLPIDGVNLVDPSTPVMRDYLALTSGKAGLYGDTPYDVSGSGRPYMMRQTSCFQKFSSCRDRLLVARSLPVALFEISDSYRREPKAVLQLAARLRRFHLPEAHVHARTLADAAELAVHLHPLIMSTMAELETDVALLISTTHEFAARHAGHLRMLVSHMNGPALLKVSPPGAMCQDGVEIDVEYKIVDSAGCCRELATFQIDEKITTAFGVRCDDGTIPATIHAVPTGGVERYIYLLLDSNIRPHAAGRRRHPPLTMSPIVTRVVPTDPGAVESAISIADRLHRAGIRTELDDRGAGLTSAIDDADSLLVPFLVMVGSAPGSETVRVRDFASRTARSVEVGDLIREIMAASQPPSGEVPKLSRQPLAWSGRRQ